jgi:hypothetical protein
MVSAKRPTGGNEGAPKKPSKKDQVLALWHSGIDQVSDLAHMTGSRASYVASVLQEAGLMTGYFDLYTHSDQPMNVYSKYFAGRLGFRDEETARASLEHIDRLYQQFGVAEDRAGQHHAMVMALTLFNRARWTNKPAEAAIFGAWLAARLQEGAAVAPAAKAAPSGKGGKARALQRDPTESS